MGIPVKYDSSVQAVCIGASAGGTEALAAIIPALPVDFPCIVVVQHILEGFAEMLAETLDAKSALDVHIARNGERLKRGTVLIAGDGAQLRICASSDGVGCAQVCQGESERVSGHCPSVDVLFESAAMLGPATIGVILTGMGSDGSQGLLAMRRAGARTIGQDQESSAVYGMPKAAVLTGAVQKQVPLGRIAAQLVLMCREAS